MAEGDGAGEERPERVQRMRARLDLRAGRGLEVGPLFSPVVHKYEADVRYVDVQLTPALREHYATHPGIPVDDIVDVDHALIESGVGRPLSVAVQPSAPFDWVVASHVVEHVPDLIGWFGEVASVMRDDATLVLAVPDRRFCFDVMRPPTTVGAMLQAHWNADDRPSVRAVFDHFSSAADVETAALWRGDQPGPECAIHDLDYAWSKVRESIDTETYLDCHVWLFTPGSFVSQLRTLAELGMLDLTMDWIEPTRRNELEFLVALRRVPRGLHEAERRAEVVAGFPNPEDAAALDDVQIGEPELSELERRVVDAKRRVMGITRRGLRRLRRP